MVHLKVLWKTMTDNASCMHSSEQNSLPLAKLGAAIVTKTFAHKQWEFAKGQSEIQMCHILWVVYTQVLDCSFPHSNGHLFLGYS